MSLRVGVDRWVVPLPLAWSIYPRAFRGSAARFIFGGCRT